MLIYRAIQTFRCPAATACLLLLGWALAPVASAQCNTAPTAVADTTETPDNKVLWIDVLANDHDPDGQPLTVTVVSETCPGAVAASSGGLLSYTPLKKHSKPVDLYRPRILTESILNSNDVHKDANFSSLISSTEGYPCSVIFRPGA